MKLAMDIAKIFKIQVEDLFEFIDWYVFIVIFMVKIKHYVKWYILGKYIYLFV